MPPGTAPPAAAVPTVALLQRAPRGRLAPLIERLWTAERAAGLPHAREWNLPSGQAHLVLPLDRPALRRFAGSADAHGFELPGGLLQGATDQPSLRCTATASIVVGAVFHPAALGTGWPLPAAEAAGQVLALQTLWPGFTPALRRSLKAHGELHQPAARLDRFEAALEDRLAQHLARLAGLAGTAAGAADALALDPLIVQALPLLSAGQPVGEVQRALGCSPAGFARRFRRACGLTPQRWQALQRLRRALELAFSGLGWAEVAAASGHADQAHLVRQCRRWIGATPGAWKAAGAGHPQHMAWAPMPGVEIRSRQPATAAAASQPTGDKTAAPRPPSARAHPSRALP